MKIHLTLIILILLANHFVASLNGNGKFKRDIAELGNGCDESSAEDTDNDTTEDPVISSDTPDTVTL